MVEIKCLNKTFAPLNAFSTRCKNTNFGCNLCFVTMIARPGLPVPGIEKKQTGLEGPGF